MATYAAFKHVELYNVGNTKKRVLKPPGGGSSDIFGGDAPQTPRGTSKNHFASNIFAVPEPINNRTNGETPRRHRAADSHNRLFGEPERQMSTSKNHLKSSIPFGAADEVDRKSSAPSTPRISPKANGHSNGGGASSNGSANGNSNGHEANGHANGNGNMNGKANGKMENGGPLSHSSSANGNKVTEIEEITSEPSSLGTNRSSSSIHSNAPIPPIIRLENFDDDAIPSTESVTPLNTDRSSSSHSTITNTNSKNISPISNKSSSALSSSSMSSSRYSYQTTTASNSTGGGSTQKLNQNPFEITKTFHRKKNNNILASSSTTTSATTTSTTTNSSATNKKHSKTMNGGDNDYHKSSMVNNGINGWGDTNQLNGSDRNIVTGNGISVPYRGYRRNAFGSQRDFNPITGESYKPAGAEINTTVPALNGANQVINKNRIPPGGFSSKLW